jgi:uncharacterized protein YkwD
LALTVLGPCLLAAGTIGCAGAAPPPPPTTTTTPAPTPAAEVVSLTNARRAAAGCGPVASQPQLARAAQGHADDMAAHGYFSHTGRDGSAPWDRARAQGYTGSGIGENIAQGYPTAAAVVDGWMNSSGHRANIENCAYGSIGVGYHAATKTWVQVFGT